MHSERPLRRKGVGCALQTVSQKMDLEEMIKSRAAQAGTGDSGRQWGKRDSCGQEYRGCPEGHLLPGLE